jgi:hypothetical protein
VTDYFQGVTKEVARLALCLVLFLLIMRFVFLDWFRWTFSPVENPGRDQEIVRPFDSFTSGPAPVQHQP